MACHRWTRWRYRAETMGYSREHWARWCKNRDCDAVEAVLEKPRRRAATIVDGDFALGG